MDKILDWRSTLDSSTEAYRTALCYQRFRDGLPRLLGTTIGLVPTFGVDSFALSAKRKPKVENWLSASLIVTNSRTLFGAASADRETA